MGAPAVVRLGDHGRVDIREERVADADGAASSAI